LTIDDTTILSGIVRGAESVNVQDHSTRQWIGAGRAKRLLHPRCVCCCSGCNHWHAPLWLLYPAQKRDLL